MIRERRHVNAIKAPLAPSGAVRTRWSETQSRFRLGSLAITAALLFVGCSAPHLSASDSPAAELPTWCTAGPCLGVPADPPRRAIVRESAGCVWLEIDGQRAAALWPRGYHAKYQPFRAYDELGRQVAQADAPLTTIVLGPFGRLTDWCGLTQTVQLYFDVGP